MRRRPADIRRATHQLRRIAAELRTARAKLGLSDRDLARLAGVSRSTIRRLLDGSPSIQVDTAVAVLAAVGLDLVLNAYEGATPALRDSGQLEIAEVIRASAHAYWRTVSEVAAGPYGRSADLVLYGAEEVIHIEIERGANDFQAQERGAKRKREFLAGGESRPVRLVLVIEDTRANRLAMGPHQGLIRSQYPATSRKIMAALRHGRPLGRDGVLWIRRPQRRERQERG
jgi:transcriptional regulator with XRE-family HTH domain